MSGSEGMRERMREKRKVERMEGWNVVGRLRIEAGMNVTPKFHQRNLRPNSPRKKCQLKKKRKKKKKVKNKDAHKITFPLVLLCLYLW
jgi:hypothetical protein